MAWRWMRLRNSKVLARSDERGALVSNGGRVEIRYKPNDGRAYFAGPSNLEPVADAPELLPDDFCAEGQRVESKKPGKTKSKSKSKAKAPASALPSEPEAEEILAYADGACSGNPGPAGLGVVALWDDQRRELSEYLGQGTNNIAELTAILRALELAAELDRPLRLYTDSQYSIGILTKGWKAKANQALVAEIRGKLAQRSDVRIFYVPGHQGVTLNEAADELAVQAVQARKSSGWIRR